MINLEDTNALLREAMEEKLGAEGGKKLPLELVLELRRDLRESKKSDQEAFPHLTLIDQIRTTAMYQKGMRTTDEANAENFLNNVSAGLLSTAALISGFAFLADVDEAQDWWRTTMLGEPDQVKLVRSWNVFLHDTMTLADKKKWGKFIPHLHVPVAPTTWRRRKVEAYNEELYKQCIKYTDPTGAGGVPMPFQDEIKGGRATLELVEDQGRQVVDAEPVHAALVGQAQELAAQKQSQAQELNVFKQQLHGIFEEFRTEMRANAAATKALQSQVEKMAQMTVPAQMTGPAQQFTQGPQFYPPYNARQVDFAYHQDPYGSRMGQGARPRSAGRTGWVARPRGAGDDDHEDEEAEAQHDKEPAPTPLPPKKPAKQTQE
jgi:hypothetical protein